MRISFNTSNPFIEKVISGGQTGIDRLGLEVARELGIPTGGTAPKGFWTENGSDLSLKDFGLVEHAESGYPPRTRQNVIDSDGTVLFGNLTSVGSAETIKYCKAYGKPCIGNPSIPLLVEFLLTHRIRVLNVAGNRGSKFNSLQLRMFREILAEALKMCMKVI